MPAPEPGATTSSRSFRLGLLVIALGALAWRLLYVWHWKGHDSDLSDEGDAFYYSAQAIANTDGSFFTHPIFGGPAADHPPLTAVLLMPVSWMDEHVVVLQRGVMAVVGTLTVVVLGLLGRRLAGDRAGLLAAAVAAVYAPLWLNDGLLMAEAPAALLVSLTLLLTVRTMDDGVTLADAALLGVLVGLATLTRAELALLLPLLGLLVLVRARGQGGALLRPALVSVGCAGLVLLPWVAWNLSRFEEPTLLSTNDGLTILGANCPSTYYSPAIGFWDLRCALEVPTEGDQSEQSATWRAEGVEFVQDNLGRVPKVAVARVGRLWGVYEPRQMVFLNDGEGREAWASWIAMWQSWIALPLAIAGAVVLRRRGRPVGPLVAMALLVTVTAMAFYGIVRFRVPADVAIVVLVGVAIDAALPRRHPTAPVG